MPSVRADTLLWHVAADEGAERLPTTKETDLMRSQSPSPPDIRLAGADDARTIADLINLAFQVEQFFIDGDRTTIAEVQSRMATGAFFLALHDQQVVGTVYAERRSTGRGYIALLAVDPRQQGYGIGRLLMNAAESHCAKLGCAGVDISVLNLRTELPPFYAMLGYRETGTAPFPDSRAQLPCHFILMSKEFSSLAGGHDSSQ
jgi:predicted N-acetyltransferase YhbS